MEKVLPKIEYPALVLQGRLDSDIKPNNMDEIFNRINSKNKRKIMLEKNDHSILNSQDHQRIFSELIKFISKICN
jgi:esterase/lipase